MVHRPKTVLAVAALLLGAAVAAAQTTVEVRRADMAVPFGSATGQIVVVTDQFVFIDNGQPDASFAVARADVVTLKRDGDTLLLTTRTPVRDRSGERTEFRFRLSDAAAVMAWYGATAEAAGAGPTPADSDAMLTYQVKHDHRIGSCQGRLIVMDDRLAFESIDEIGDSRQWVLEDIKELKLDGIYRLKITPFLGNAYNLDLVGKGMDSAQYRTLVDRIAEARVAR